MKRLLLRGALFAVALGALALQVVPVIGAGVNNPGVIEAIAGPGITLSPSPCVSGSVCTISSNGGGGGVNDCAGNSNSSDVLYNQAGTCKGINAFEFDNTNKATLNDTGTAPPTVIGGGRLVIEGTQGGSPTADAGPKVVINGFTSGSFGGEPSIGYAASSGTPASPTALSNALIASPVLAYAYNGTNYQGTQGAVARIDVWNDTASGTFSGTDMGTGICLGTTGRGSTSILLDSLCVDDNRGVVLRGNLYTGTPQGDGTLNSAGLYHKNIAFRLDTATNTDTVPLTESYTNAGTTGTTAGLIAKIDTSGHAVTVGTGDTTDGIGICVAVTGYTCGITSNAAIAYAGQVSCQFDSGGNTAGHWVIISTVTAGKCSDGGASVPTTVEVLGVSLSTNVGAGTYAITLNPLGVAAAQAKAKNTIQCSQLPAETGDVVTSGCAATIQPNVVTNAKIAQAVANTVKGNFTASTANEADNAMPSCSDSGGNHLNYVSGSGITCGTSSSGGTCATITNAACLNQIESFTATQSGAPQTLTISGVTYTPAAGAGNNITLTIANTCHGCTFANPTGTPIAGTTGVIYFLQDSTGGGVINSWGSDYLAVGGTGSLPFSAAANAIDVYSYTVVDSTHIILLPGALNATH